MDILLSLPNLTISAYWEWLYNHTAVLFCIHSQAVILLLASQLNRAASKIVKDGEVSLVFKPACLAPLFAIDSKINNLIGFDQKTNRNRKELMEISKAQTINYESCVCRSGRLPVVES